MTNKKAFEVIAQHASPFIQLGYVLDDKGSLLFNFHIHPQIRGDCFITLDQVSTDSKEIMITPDDVREFADRLKEFADVADTLIDEYNKQTENLSTV